MYLYGAGGHAKVIIDILTKNKVDIKGIYDDNNEINEISGHPVLNTQHIQGPLVISIGNNQIRKRLADTLKINFAIVKDKSAIISSSVEVGEGSVIVQGTIIQTNTKIGRHCIINTGSKIDHECRVGDFVHISPGTTLCGDVQVNEGSWIGAGSVILPGITIGKWSIIGAGSVVTRDIPDNVIAYGNSCRIIKNIIKI